MKELKLRQDQQVEMYLAAMQSILFKGLFAYGVTVNWPETYEHMSDLRRHFKSKMEKLDRDHLMRVLEWHLYSGQRASFEKHRLHLSALTDGARKQYIQSCASDPQLFHKLQIVNRYATSLPNSHIAALDLAWVVYLTRGGFHLELITEEEHWNYLDQCITINKQTYSSWAEYIIGSTVGAYYTNIGDYRHYLQISDEQLLYQRLLYGRYSPMRKIDIQGRKL